MQDVTPAAMIAFALELIPAVCFAFASGAVTRAVQRWPSVLKVSFPALFVGPYLVVSISTHSFGWSWLFLYAGLPVVIAWLLLRASADDAEQRGNWRDGLILLLIGLAVDLRWFEGAWPSGLRALNELFLVDAGLYGFMAIRQLTGTGFDFRLRVSDWRIGFRELILFAPIVIVLGLALGFIHPHRNMPGVGSAVLRWIAIFLFTALPEELFFRAWVQNLLERRLGRHTALMVASVIFGLSHFNKRSTHFNWPYVALATIAGIFYGRAWRKQRRVPASTITHATVDWMWGLWF